MGEVPDELLPPEDEEDESPSSLNEIFEPSTPLNLGVDESFVSSSMGPPELAKRSLGLSSRSPEKERVRLPLGLVIERSALEVVFVNFILYLNGVEAFLSGC